MKRNPTEQEEFWKGEFGNDYLERNTEAVWLASNIALFARILAHTGPVGSILEFGPNIGLNLQALRQLLPSCELAGVEINDKAAAKLKEWGGAEVFGSSIQDFDNDGRTWDLTFSKGVLIHIDPESLPLVYDKIYHASNRYVVLVEYYNPSPVAIPYRGHNNKLFKRDFAGEMLDRFDQLRLLDYGFFYHRDPHFPQDDANWFLLEKMPG